MSEENINLTGALEAVLFVLGESASLKQLAEALGRKETEISVALEALKEELASRKSGLDLVLWNGRAGLISKPEFGEIINGILKNEFSAELSPASLETLSMVAYLGPMSRSEIDYLRGVNSSFILRSLSVRGLVERVSELSVGRGPLYQVTAGFLNHVGLGDSKDLPDYEKYREVLKLFREAEKSSEEKENKSQIDR